MKLILTIITILALYVEVFAQKEKEFANVDKLMLQIPSYYTNTTTTLAEYVKNNFTNDNDKVRAIYIWVAKNIEYDVDNMFALNFYQNKSEIIDKVLKTRTGICMHYAELFNEIANKAGIKSYVISGYTKQNGFVDYISHAWCAALIDSTYYIFDPTWGSGYITKSKFVRLINNTYFKAKPEQMIKSHIPFDPLWQLLSFPLTSSEFYNGGMKNDNTPRQYFNFKDSIDVYDKQTEIERLISSTNRIEKNGVKNSLTFDRLQNNKREIEYYKKKLITEQYNSAVGMYNTGINLLNDFIDFRNRQFIPKKTDTELKFMLDTVEACFDFSREQLKAIKNPDPNISNSIVQLYKSMDDANKNYMEQRDFLVRYLKSGKIARKSMFYKLR